jgi:hypothetical protein
MNPHRSNADGNGGAVLTLVRLILPETTKASEVEADEVYYSDWAPKKGGSASVRRTNTSVVSGAPSVIFVQDVGEPLQRSRLANLPLALFSVAFFIYAVPTTLEFFASRHFGPWFSTILPGDLVGCLWLGVVSRMRLVGLLLYIFLTSSESVLYGFGLVDSGSLLWLTDLVPALLVAAVMTARSKRRYS